MNELANDKFSLEKDARFFDYMKRLVEAPHMKEIERFHGSKVLKDFVLDKNSIVSSKKRK